MTNCSASLKLSSSSMTRIRLGDIVSLLLYCRQYDGNRRALAELALKRHGTTVLRYDLFSVGHTETKPLLLRCEERLEDFFCLLLSDATTGVRDFQLQRLISLVDGDTQDSAVRHGLDGIQHEIHQSPTYRGFVKHRVSCVISGRE